MRSLYRQFAMPAVLAAVSPAASAATQEEALAIITEVMVAVFAAFVVAVIVGEWLGKRDEAPPRGAIHERPLHER